MCIGYRLGGGISSSYLIFVKLPFAALFELKVILSALIRNFDFTDTGAKIVTQYSLALQPYIEGKKEDGVQIPLIIKDLHR